MMEGRGWGWIGRERGNRKEREERGWEHAGRKKEEVRGDTDEGDAEGGEKLGKQS